MAIHGHLKKLAGLSVRDWGTGVDWSAVADAEVEAEAGDRPAIKFPPIRNPEKSAFRLSLDYEEADGGVSWQDKFDRFLVQKNAHRVAGLVVGSWSPDDSMVSSAAVVKAVAKAAGKLPNLRALFLGDITGEETEISWITQSDVGPLLAAHPQLEYLGVRGGTGLKFQVARHDRLKTLVIDSGGLSRKLVRQVFQAELPALEHLELWLGEENYGADTTPEDLAPLLAGTRFPKLKRAGAEEAQDAGPLARHPERRRRDGTPRQQTCEEAGEARRAPPLLLAARGQATEGAGTEGRCVRRPGGRGLGRRRSATVRRRRRVIATMTTARPGSP